MNVALYFPINSKITRCDNLRKREISYEIQVTIEKSWQLIRRYFNLVFAVRRIRIVVGSMVHY